MHKSYIKKGFFAVALMLLISLLTFCSFSFVSYGESEEQPNTANYFTMTAQFKEEGNFAVGLEVGVDFAKYCEDGTQLSNFTKALFQNFETLKEEEIANLNEFYQSSLDEKYLPSENITFGSVEIDQLAQKCKMTVDFSSYDVYFHYYDAIVYNEIEGFMTSKIAIDIHEPFDKKLHNGESLRQKLMGAIVSAGEAISSETIKNDYKPTLSFEFVTSNGRAFSNAKTIGYDAEGLYHHVWQLDNLQKGFILKLRLNIFNKGWWYLFALAIPLAVMIVAIIVVGISNKKKKIYQKRF